jgi:glutaredoxin
MRIPFLHRPSPSAAPGTVAPVDPDAPAAEPVLVYGGAWCIDCHVVTRFLDRQQVPYRWIDLARDQAAQERISALGYRAIPVVMLPDGRTLVEPSTRQLADALGISLA